MRSDMAMKPKILQLALNGEYFDAIKSGEKLEEFRLVSPYWVNRLTIGGMNGHVTPRHYTGIVLTRGYPKRDDASRRIELPWRGFTVKTITHPHFGDHPVKVFAIKVNIAEA